MIVGFDFRSREAMRLLGFFKNGCVEAGCCYRYHCRSVDGGTPRAKASWIRQLRIVWRMIPVWFQRRGSTTSLPGNRTAGAIGFNFADNITSSIKSTSSKPPTLSYVDRSTKRAWSPNTREVQRTRIALPISRNRNRQRRSLIRCSNPPQIGQPAFSICSLALHSSELSLCKNRITSPVAYRAPAASCRPRPVASLMTRTRPSRVPCAISRVRSSLLPSLTMI